MHPSINQTQATPVLHLVTPTQTTSPLPSSSGIGGNEPPYRPKYALSDDSGDRPRKRGRRRIKADELASVRIETRVHPSEFLAFKQRCERGGITPSAAIREFVRTGTFAVVVAPPAVEWSGATEGVQRDLRAYGINLNQIARALNSIPPSGEITALTLARVKQAVETALKALQALVPVESAAPKVPHSVVELAKPAPAPKSRTWLNWPSFKKGA